jgi:diguanylate cyclase (GGDEF)-like protein
MSITVSRQPSDEGPSLFVQNLPGSFAELGPLGHEVRLEAGAVLWREGDPGDHVILLVEGRLEVSHETPDGDEITIRHLYPGAVAGEMAALDGQARSATVRAHGAARVLMIPAGSFRDFLRSRPDLLEQLFWLQVERVRSLTWRVSRTHHKAITDPLTGLYNYGFFRERLAIELERAEHTGDPVSLAMFDIDHFKHYNDTNGHLAGDKLLQDLAHLVPQSIRKDDIFGRYGGEAFLLILPNTNLRQGLATANKIRAMVAAHPFAFAEGQPLGSLSVSGGVAEYPHHGHDAQGLLHAADDALYEAKQQGRNRVAGARAAQAAPITPPERGLATASASGPARFL